MPFLEVLGKDSDGVEDLVDLVRAFGVFGGGS